MPPARAEADELMLVSRWLQQKPRVQCHDAVGVAASRLPVVVGYAPARLTRRPAPVRAAGRARTLRSPTLSQSRDAVDAAGHEQRGGDRDEREQSHDGPEPAPTFGEREHQ